MKRAFWALVAAVLVLSLVGCSGVSQTGFGGTRTYTPSSGSTTARHTRETTDTKPATAGQPASGKPVPGAPQGTAGPGGTLVASADDPAQPQVITDEKYNNWDCYKLRNPFVTAVAVPAIGGRVMEYKLGAYPFLYTNELEYGKTYTDVEINAQPEWHNFGGFTVWPAPQTTWEDRISAQWLPPAVFDLLPFEAKTLSDNLVASVELTSAKDPEGTGLQTKRTLALYPHSTRLTVTETFANVTDKSVRWSVWDVTQVRGAVEKDKPFSEKAVVYVPVDKLSKLENGYKELITGEEKQVERREQWKPDIAPDILGVVYKQVTGKIGADSKAGWIAYTDEANGFVYVKRFTVFPDEEYPDGCTVEVYTDGEKPYLELQVLSPLRELMPGDTYSFTVDWLAARCHGPIRSCTEAGVVSQPLALARQPGKDPLLTGKFGIFHEGKARLVFIDDKSVVTEYKQVDVSPLAPLELSEPVSIPKGTKRVALQILNTAGTPIGTDYLSEVKVG